MTTNRPCPRCGGDDRFFLIAQPRSGGTPFWLCRQCRYTESATPGERIHRDPIRRLTTDERLLAQRAYAAIAEWCAGLLWATEGREALAYLRGRGLSDATIAQARLGYHPDTPLNGGVGLALYHREQDLYHGAQLGGLVGPQCMVKRILRGVITIPYWNRGTCTLIRMRNLHPTATVKYFSPSGVSLYLGGTPTLYNQDILSDTTLEKVVLTEGEFKALLAQQEGIPAVAQPGIGFLPPAYIDALRGHTVIIGYDSEQRTDPFRLSPGEQHTLRAVSYLTGIRTREEIGKQIKALEELRQKNKTAGPDEQTSLLVQMEAISAQLTALREEIAAIEQLRIKVRVLRLPRNPDMPKIDLDAYIQRHGAEATRALIAQAPDGEIWHTRHSGGGYTYERGGIYNGKLVANYQARIMETIHVCDGQQTTAIQRMALRAPSGSRQQIDIPADTWADDRAARQALRVGLREGTFDDDSREVLRAVRLLSNQGDPPVERTQYTCTGWENIDGHWHYLTADGAVHASGMATNVRAEIDPEAIGNHYAICAPGDATQGAAAWRSFLRGEVCPQPLALILAGQAALPLLHRFGSNSARTMLWLYYQSGALKTALTRAAVMALYGPAYTGERADGAPVPKWDSTSTGLGYLGFYYRDLPLLIDDYKQGVIHPDQFKRFLHNYSESTGRTRATKHQQIDRIRPARCIVFSTAEDLPSIGDYGMEARLLALQLHPGAVKEEPLAALQRAGAAGHLTAFWRGFVQTLAGELDRLGEDGVRQRMQSLIAADDAELPGHRRAAGALRQNRAAWLVLSSWLVRAGHITHEEAAELNAAHLEARALLAQVLTDRQKDSRPSTIFLSVLNELIATGDLVIEREPMTCPRCSEPLRYSTDGWYCTGTVGEHSMPCPYHLPTGRVVGFTTADGIGIYAEKAFREVSRVRNDQRQPFAFSSTAIWQQLDADGALVAKDKGGRFQVVRRNPARRGDDLGGKPQKVLLLKASVFDDKSCEMHDPMGSMGSMGSWGDAAHQREISSSQGHGIMGDLHGIMEAQNPVSQDSHDPMIPSRSHAWDHDFEAPTRAETPHDPMDPMNFTYTPISKPNVSHKHGRDEIKRRQAARKRAEEQ